MGGLQKEGALLVISASRLAQTEPILQLYVLKGTTSQEKFSDVVDILGY